MPPITKWLFQLKRNYHRMLQVQLDEYQAWEARFSFQEIVLYLSTDHQPPLTQVLPVMLQISVDLVFLTSKYNSK